MMRRLAGIALAFLVAGSVALLGGPVHAQEEPPLVVRKVDSRDPAAVQVTFTYEGNRSDLAGLVVREDDLTVDATSARPLAEQQGLAIVLAIDASGSMRGELIERVLEAARGFVDGKLVDDQIAIVTFNRDVEVVQGFTADKAELNRALDSVALAAETSLYDGIVRSAALLADSTRQPNIIVFSDGEDSASSASADVAKAAIDNVGGTLHAIGVDNDGFRVLQRIAAETGGTAAQATDANGVGALFEAVQASLRKQYVFTYPTRSEGGTVALTLTVGDERTNAEFVSGSSQTGTGTLRPEPAAKPSGPKFLRSEIGLIIGLGLTALAIVVAVASVGGTFLLRDATLDQALQPYGEGFVADAGFDSDDGGDGRGPQLAQTQLLQRAVKATGEFAERQGLLTKVEGLLERANLQLRPPEAIFFYLAGTVVLAILLVVITANPLTTLIGTAIGAMVPPALLSFLADRRRKQFDSLLPDTLQLLASTLRAGYSLMQGVEAVSQEVSEPVGRELRRVVTEARLGRPLEESLEGVAARMESGDFAWAVMAIRIQREVGGNLAELLVTVADTMTERERLRRDVNALTAEGRVSAVVLGVLPFGIGMFILGSNPDYLDPLFDETVGNFLLGGAVVAMLAGFYWMKKTIEIEI
jgi:tight adherence protein B